MSKWFISVTAGRWQVASIQRVRALGYKVVAIDTDQNAEGFKIADKAICRSLDDTFNIFDDLDSLSGRICGAASFVSDVGIYLTALIRERYGLSGPTRHVSMNLTSKKLQREIWEKASVPSTKFKTFTSAEDALHYCQIQSNEFVIKPIDSSGSRGVFITNRSSLKLSDYIESSLGFSQSKEIIVETFMEGSEFTVESFLVNGKHFTLAITQKKKVTSGRCTVSCELSTSNCSPDIRNKLSDAVSSAYNALGYSSGPGHAEVILKKDGEVGLVEVAGRGGGFLVYEKLVPAVCGLDVIQMAIDQAVGLHIADIQPMRREGVLRFIPTKSGILASVDGIEFINRLEGVEADLIANIGDELRDAETDADRVAWILSTGQSFMEAQDRADLAESMISVNYYDIC